MTKKWKIFIITAWIVIFVVIIFLNTRKFEQNIQVNPPEHSGSYSYLFKEDREFHTSNIVGYFANGAFVWYLPDWMSNWKVEKFGLEGIRIAPAIRVNQEDFSDIIINVSTSSETNFAEKLFNEKLNTIPKKQILISEITLNNSHLAYTVSLLMETNDTKIYHIRAYTKDFKKISDFYFIDGNGKTLDLSFEAKAEIYLQFSDKIRIMAEGIGESKDLQK